MPSYPGEESFLSRTAVFESPPARALSGDVPGLDGRQDSFLRGTKSTPYSPRALIGSLETQSLHPHSKAARFFALFK